MKLWMDVMRDLEFVMNDHERIFAGWAEGGVDGVVFGPLEFNGLAAAEAWWEQIDGSSRLRVESVDIARAERARSMFFVSQTAAPTLSRASDRTAAVCRSDEPP